MELEKVRQIVAELMSVNIEKIDADTNFIKDLGMDSLDVFQLIAELEDAFSVELPEDAVKTVKTVGQAAEMLSRL